jgi:drug/metabolite transporter (DMT)-like permease
MALAPPIAAVVGWLVLGEKLDLVDCMGMALTLSGIMWVVLERKGDGPDKAQRHPASGVLLGLFGAAGQAVGLVLSKKGMGEYNAFAATQIRILAGIAGFSLLFFILKWWGRVFEGVKDRTSMGFAALGALMGPFLGVSLSLVAVQHTQTGIAATIMAMTPVFIIPPLMIIHGEKVSLRAVLGAVVAVGGVALLWLG